MSHIRSARLLCRVPFLLLFGVLLGAPGAGHADPIFFGASVEPAVISPNGDFIQDFAVVTYNVAVDTAQVLVSVTASGTGTVATLQPATLRPLGDYTLLFDGRDDEQQILPDGVYQVVVFGLGLEGEGDETIIMDLVIDTTPPKFLGPAAQVEPETGYVQNGDLLALVVCIEGADSLFVDFSSVDSNFDPDQVVISAVDPQCRRIEYRISETNTRLDADGLVVPITAFDDGGNRADQSLAVCLLNFPPVIVDATFVAEVSVFQNADRIRAELMVASPAPVIEVTGDFSQIDSGFDSTAVETRNLGGGRYQVSYTLSEENDRTDGAYPIRLIVRDPGCGAAETVLTGTLDNSGDVDAVISNVSVVPAAFSPNGDGVLDEVEIFYSALLDTTVIRIDFQLADGSLLNIQPQTEYLAGDYAFVWDGTFVPSGVTIDNIEDGAYRIQVNGVDTERDVRRNRYADLLLDRTPPQPASVVVEPEDGLSNGEVLKITLTYPQTGHTVIPDFSQLDDQFGPGSDVSVNENPLGTHTILYVVSTGNGRDDDDDIPVPVTATDIAGNTATTTLPRTCLSNDPPRLLSARFTEDAAQPPLSNGSLFILETEWSTGSGPLTVSYDLNSIDTQAVPEDGVAREDIDRPNVFLADHRISQNNERVSGFYEIEATALDQGCGLTSTVAIQVELLVQNPDRPEFDETKIPGVTRVSPVTLTGNAVGADFVEIQVASTAVDTAVVENSVFSIAVTLTPGTNSFQAVGVDRAGNRSTRSQPVEILFVESSFVEIPKRFRPGNAFFLGLLEPADEVTIGIYNLEGLEIRRLTGGPGDLLSIPWDGVDNRGNVASSGPYVALVRVSPHNETFRRAFVFTRR